MSKPLPHQIIMKAGLVAEQRVRLFNCAYNLECLEMLFLDLPPIFTFSDLPRRRPCPDDLWRAQDEAKWQDLRESGHLDDCAPHPGSFVHKITVLNNYIEERVFLDQIRSSRLFRHSIASEQPRFIQAWIASRPTVLQSVADSDMSTTEASCKDSVVHVVAILHHIPLKTVYASLGWQVSESSMRLAREMFKTFLEQKGEASRKCLWHAVGIYAMLRGVQHLACYDTLSFCVAINYIWAYDCMAVPAAHGEIIRLDRQRPKVDVWVRNGGPLRLHITGVGILNGHESRTRLMADAIKMMRSQIAWRNISHGLAAGFEQTLRGVRPTLVSE
ncbi:hypothetical protein CC86DRAFT_61286 [Ophiobolus disseminans]|uniref:Transcription factor domain-containing protein n=1 Tax=Ophiobolus disseminans TaxID=1469910 RepID=A0A6A6ZSW7_9PLEO|nr:hypothetical protein CC86DRAFT_61286 [Ophiobolus disseminans]